MTRKNPETNRRILEAYNRIGTISGTSRETGHDRNTVKAHLREAGVDLKKPVFAGRVSEINTEQFNLPPAGQVKTYIITSAQNNTGVNQTVFNNLLAFVKHRNAQLVVGTFTYNKASYGRKAVKRGKGPTADDKRDLWYDPQLEEHILDKRVELAPGLVWCGEMNILPTAVEPLSGLEVYTGRKSGIFGHPKLCMDSVASGKHEPTKFNYTTGTVTKRNYIQKKAGLKAEFHHVYGGLLVEVNSEGDWFVRQLVADERTCTVYDMRDCAKGGEVTPDHDVLGINWGDIHNATLDQFIARLCWEEGGMLDTLRPSWQFFHDTMDFRSRNGHNFKRDLTHRRFADWVQGHNSVEKEGKDVSTLIDQTSRPWCTTVCVNSNHDNFILEWLRIQDYRVDPVNAVYFLEAQLHAYKSIREQPNKQPNMLKWVVERDLGRRENVRFLDEDESLVIMGIEFGMHGDLGPNGSKGSAKALARMGRRSNVGHYHSACIYEGVYAAGLTGSLEQGYNRGPSSWSHAHIVTYPNGKRAIYTMYNGRWHAGQAKSALGEKSASKQTP